MAAPSPPLAAPSPPLSISARRWLASAAPALAWAGVGVPFDVVKTCMQGDLAQARYGGVFDAGRALHAQGGAARFFDGCFWRTVNITATVLVATACCAVLPPLIKARRKGDANSA